MMLGPVLERDCWCLLLFFSFRLAGFLSSSEQRIKHVAVGPPIITAYLTIPLSFLFKTNVAFQCPTHSGASEYYVADYLGRLLRLEDHNPKGKKNYNYRHGQNRVMNKCKAFIEHEVDKSKAL